jgi:multisubunit Na+/H+ antiporter MnhF subunit
MITSTLMLTPVLGAAWSQAVLSWSLTGAMVALAFAMLCCVWRLLRGPHLADRALAVDTFGILLIGMVIVFAMQFQTLWFADGILVLSLLSFAGTVAMAQYIGRPHLRRQQGTQDGQNAPQETQP